MMAKKGVLMFLNLLCTLLSVLVLTLPCEAAGGERKLSEQNGSISLSLNDDHGDGTENLYSMLFGSDGADGIADSSFMEKLSSYETWLSDYSTTDLMNALTETMSTTAITYLTIMLIVACLWCFLGYRIYPFFVALVGVGLSLIIGAIVAVVTESEFWLLIFLVSGIVFAVLCVKFKSLGAFLIGFVNCWFVPTLLAVILVKSFRDALIIGTIIAIICGIITAIFKKPIIIVGTVMNYAPVAGFAFACLMGKTEWSLFLQILFVLAGFFVQTKINHGLLERGSLIKYLKNKFSSKPKVEASELEWMTPIAQPDTISSEADASSEHIASATVVQVCPHCDTRNQPDDAFCYCCGYPLRVKEESDAADVPISIPSPVEATISENPVIAMKRKTEIPVGRSESAFTAATASGKKLKFSGFSEEKPDSSSSVVIKVGDGSKSRIVKTEVASENRSLGIFKATNDFDDE